MILTILAPEVAARTGQGQTSGAWMEMVERLLLNGIDGQRTRLGIDLADKCTTTISSTATDARLAIGYAAMMRTDQTLHSSIIQTLIISTLHQNTIAS
jgi:hypothetical protein